MGAFSRIERDLEGGRLGAELLASRPKVLDCGRHSRLLLYRVLWRGAQSSAKHLRAALDPAGIGDGGTVERRSKPEEGGDPLGREAAELAPTDEASERSRSAIAPLQVEKDATSPWWLRWRRAFARTWRKSRGSRWAALRWRCLSSARTVPSCRSTG